MKSVRFGHYCFLLLPTTAITPFPRIQTCCNWQQKTSIHLMTETSTPFYSSYLFQSPPAPTRPLPTTPSQSSRTFDMKHGPWYHANLLFSNNHHHHNSPKKFMSWWHHGLSKIHPDTNTYTFFGTQSLTVTSYNNCPKFAELWKKVIMTSPTSWSVQYMQMSTLTIPTQYLSKCILLTPNQ